VTPALAEGIGGVLAPVRISGVVVTIQGNPKGVPFCRYAFVTKGPKGTSGLDYSNRAVSEGGSLRAYVRIGIGILAVIIGLVVWGVMHYSGAQPDFWKNFVPGVLANIIGVGVGAIVGIPIGLAINHYVAAFGERQHHERQVVEVRSLLEQIRIELNVHFTSLAQISALSLSSKSGLQIPTTALTPLIAASEIGSLTLADASGQQFISNRSVLEIGEMQVLFHVSNYYTRLSDLNRLLAWRVQDQKNPETWDRKISDLAYTLSSMRAQLDYDIRQALTRLAGVNG
jgi:hypothetical protein